jgi:uncharacterized protein
MPIRKWMAALLAGAVFAVGLVLSGMTQPARVLGFLNVGGLFAPERFGPWDASLAFVMGGALCVTLLAFQITPRRGRRPWLGGEFMLPVRTDIDGRLLAGAALFGIGWGLAGYCPGPALALLWTGNIDTLMFIAAMVVGMGIARKAVG